MKTIAVIAGLIALFGIAGTPDYVLDVERENERLRTEIKRTTMELKRVRRLNPFDIRACVRTARSEKPI